MIKLPKHSNAQIQLSIENTDEIPLIAALCDALGNEVRLNILKCLQKEPHQMTIGELMHELNMPKTTLLYHLKKLERVNLISEYYSATSKGTNKVFGRDMRSANIICYYNPAKESVKTVSQTQSLGVGQFADFVGTSFSLATSTHNFHFITDSCFIPERFEAQLVYTHNGVITYYFNNYIAKIHKVTELNLSCEICSEAPYFNNDYLSDITFWINGKEIVTYTSEGDYGDRRGYLNPDWWIDVNTQYGKLVTLSVNKKGVYLNGNFYSSKITVDDLDLKNGNKIIVKFGNKDTAENVGGFNVFGRGFGDYPQDICLKLTYEDVLTEK